MKFENSSEAELKRAAQLSRRTFLKRTSTGVGGVALSSMLAGSATAGVGGNLVIPPRCKRVIHLCMAGGPSQLETLDYKPKLAAMDGKSMPKSYTEGQQIAQLQGQRNKLRVLGPQHGFKKCGQSGNQIGNVLPHIQSIADEMCIINSMHTDQINHDPAHSLINTGTSIPGRPSMGSWLLYGLGSETDNLPGYVVLTSVGGGQSQPIASRQWHSGFLPSKFQGVEFRSQGEPVLYVKNPSGVDRPRQKEIVDAVERLNRISLAADYDPEIETKISQYELAFKMQMSVPELADISDEPQSILDLYGTQGADGSFAANCLLARRLAERGVRFIQLYHRGWDHHGNIKQGIEVTSKFVDQGSAALVKDLKQRGMLDDTLIIWGGEFGRTPMAQGNGRDHHIKGFSCWMAGGGIKPGMTYGSTDELGYAAEDKPFHVHDLHATMLHQFGLDHTRLTYRYRGRDFRLTDVAGNVVKDILA
ncbi:MAG: DUF1501 domain-containing protein [Planctomycetaceae bacterium]|nr:DUF1501 domain-containing protein [Planctomycetaceae bacterium]